MSYETARKLEVHDAHMRLIETFANTYICGRPTVVLLPGGLGSHLERSVRPYKNDSSLPMELYDPVWMDLEILFGRDADLLEILPSGHDRDEHIIIPDGPLRFLVNAYDGTERFFRQALGWNYIVFGYDWRRSLSEAAAQLEEFLTALRDRVKDLRDCDPLPTTTLLAHSQGGLIAKIFLHRVCGDDGDALARWCERLVTVATPFYGTSTHHNRYYKGQSPLNLIRGTRRIAEVAGSLPGPYILLMADRPTLDRDGPAIGLEDYPILDADTGAPCDPYDQANESRYPAWVSRQFLDAAFVERETITAVLPDAAIQRVFHIRTGLNKEPGAHLRWKNVDGSTFDPARDDSPLTPVKGAWDGTVPFWSARLAQTDKTHIYDLKRATDHGEVAEHEETLKVVQALVEKGKLPKPANVVAVNRTLGTSKATPAEMEAFVTSVRDGLITKDDPQANDPRLCGAFLKRQLYVENICSAHLTGAGCRIGTRVARYRMRPSGSGSQELRGGSDDRPSASCGEPDEWDADALACPGQE
jgi:pimeloyl-ACP methyl ester carboxylesterase